MLNKETVMKVAKLARLEISEQDAVEYQVQLSKVLENFQKIASVPTDQIEPLITPIPVESFWREDKVLQTVTAEELIKCAPEAKGHLYKVPPVV